MNEGQFRELLAVGYERRGVEFKGPGRLDDKAFVAKIIRAILGLSNSVDVGYVVIGVTQEADGSVTTIGLNKEELGTWNFDDLAAKVAAYSDPFVTFDYDSIELDDKAFVVVTVHEFGEVPVLCKRSYYEQNPEGRQREILRSGALYTRTRRMPETAEVPSQTEMRELLERATNKGIRKFLARMNASGAQIQSVKSESDHDLFSNELNQQLHENENAIEKKISSRGLWQVIVRPKRFQENLIQNITELSSILRECRVARRGWDFPHGTDTGEKPLLGTNYLFHPSEFDMHIERWRFYQSGLFYYRGGLAEDWQDESAFVTVNDSWRWGRVADVYEIIFGTTEYLQFASRLAERIGPTYEWRVEISYQKLEGRSLHINPRTRRHLTFGRYVSSIPEFTHSLTVNKQNLLASHNELALDAAIEIFRRFNWDPPRNIVSEIQAELN